MDRTFDDANFLIDRKHLLDQVRILNLRRQFCLDCVDVAEGSFAAVRNDRFEDKSLRAEIVKEWLNVHKCRTVVPCGIILVGDNDRERARLTADVFLHVANERNDVLARCVEFIA